MIAAEEAQRACVDHLLPPSIGLFGPCCRLFQYLIAGVPVMLRMVPGIRHGRGVYISVEDTMMAQIEAWQLRTHA